MRFPSGRAAGGAGKTESSCKRPGAPKASLGAGGAPAAEADDDDDEDDAPLLRLSSTVVSGRAFPESSGSGAIFRPPPGDPFLPVEPPPFLLLSESGNPLVQVVLLGSAGDKLTAARHVRRAASLVRLSSASEDPFFFVLSLSGVGQEAGVGTSELHVIEDHVDEGGCGSGLLLSLVGVRFEVLALRLPSLSYSSCTCSPRKSSSARLPDPSVLTGVSLMVVSFRCSGAEGPAAAAGPGALLVASIAAASSRSGSPQHDL